jgi:8-oxo-dGTP pyrophosphatase MutT (NUDIX family)
VRIPLPQRLVDQARAFESGDQTPAEPRDAATVVLLRDEVDGPSLYLLRRQASMAFAAGMCVFPGGAVDQRDHDVEVGWAGPSPAIWASRLGVDEAMARALVCAAVRETFEESGVLLAGPSADSVVSDTTGTDWEADRVALESKEHSFSDFLAKRGLVVRSDLLGAWSGWLTPVFEPRRFRTWFFVAVLPHGQVTRDVSSESSSVAWLPALTAVAQVEAGDMLMLPPTYLTSLEIGQYADPAAVLSAASSRHVEMFMPEVTSSGEEFVLSSPPGTEELLATRSLS